MADMCELARVKGGVCLSSEYLGTDTKLTWRCSAGHVWEARPAKIKRGQWCRHCAGLAPKGLAFLATLAAKRGGECISNSYLGMDKAAEWRCANGHEWLARPSNVRSGTWCPFCAGKRQEMADMHALAQSRGGTCLSIDYLGQANKLEWQCKDGHRWRATPGSIKNGSWCPHCNVNYGEEICRAYFEEIFSKSFPKSRPSFLRTKLRGVLELDGYCEELALAFEHHGGQHYKRVAHFHRHQDDFRRQQYRDEKKQQLCRAAGVTVIEIPEVPRLTPLDQLPGVISSRLRAARIEVSRDPSEVKVDLNRVFDRSALEVLLHIARSRGGKLISTSYLGDKNPLEWICKEGHQWKAAPNGIKNGTWCPYCYGNVRTGIDEVRARALSKGIVLLSTEYLGTNRKLHWRCEKGHDWWAIPHKVLHETGCPRCAGKHTTIADMQSLAAQHDGSCTSREYLGSTVHLNWRCSAGHDFKMSPAIARKSREHWCPVCARLRVTEAQRQAGLRELSAVVTERGGRILNGRYENGNSRLDFECSHGHLWNAVAWSVKRRSWCPHCSSADHIERTRSARLGIDAMKSLAASRSGECLSDEYVNNSSSLRWRCSKGHMWLASPSNIKNGRWCPYCAGKAKKTLADMHALAKLRGLRFLSAHYIGDDKHHDWECGQGHRWSAKPSNIKQGRGCPTCARAGRWASRRQRQRRRLDT